MSVDERCEAQADRLLALIHRYAPDVEFTGTEESMLEHLEEFTERSLPGFLRAWLSRVGGGTRGVQLLDTNFDVEQLIQAQRLWGRERAGFLLVAIGDGPENSDYYYDLARPSAESADDYEVVGLSRVDTESPPPSRRTRAHGYSRSCPSLREFLSFHAFRQLRRETHEYSRAAIASAILPDEVEPWMARFGELVARSGFEPVGGLEGQWQLHDREDASLTLAVELERGSRLIGVGARDPRELELLLERLIDHLHMRLVAEPHVLLE